MKLIAILLFASAVGAQTCTHSIKYAPVGPILLFRNGRLLQEGPDFTTAKVPGTTRCCIVTPLAFADQDLISVVITRALDGHLWRTDWTCTGSLGVTPPAPPFPGCASDGANGLACVGAIAAGKTQQISGGIDFGGASGGRVGLAAADNAGPVFYQHLLPTDDGTGKFLHNSGVVQCPLFDALVIAKNPVCIKWEWVAIP